MYIILMRHLFPTFEVNTSVLIFSKNLQLPILNLEIESILSRLTAEKFVTSLPDFHFGVSELLLGEERDHSRPDPGLGKIFHEALC